MKVLKIHADDEFRVLAGTERSQAAVMMIQTAESEGGPDNRHDGDQWLYVLSGEGEAVVNGTVAVLAPGTLLLIEAGETHEIRCTAMEPLRTLNIYAPPQY